jgi:hypothetical protein
LIGVSSRAGPGDRDLLLWRIVGVTLPESSLGAVIVDVECECECEIRDKEAGVGVSSPPDRPGPLSSSSAAQRYSKGPLDGNQSESWIGGPL